MDQFNVLSKRWNLNSYKTNVAKQGQLVKELIEVDFFVTIVVIQDVESVGNISLAETKLRVQRVEQKHDCSDVDGPQRVTV